MEPPAIANGDGGCGSAPRHVMWMMLSHPFITDRLGVASVPPIAPRWDGHTPDWMNATYWLHPRGSHYRSTIVKRSIAFALSGALQLPCVHRSNETSCGAGIRGALKLGGDLSVRDRELEVEAAGPDDWNIASSITAGETGGTTIPGRFRRRAASANFNAQMRQGGSRVARRRTRTAEQGGREWHVDELEPLNRGVASGGSCG